MSYCVSQYGRLLRVYAKQVGWTRRGFFVILTYSISETQNKVALIKEYFLIFELRCFNK